MQLAVDDADLEAPGHLNVAADAPDVVFKMLDFLQHLADRLPQAEIDIPLRSLLSGVSQKGFCL